MDVIVIAIGIKTGNFLSYLLVAQDTCSHDAKVTMAGYKN